MKPKAIQLFLPLIRLYSTYFTKTKQKTKRKKKGEETKKGIRIKDLYHNCPRFHGSRISHLSE